MNMEPSRLRLEMLQEVGLVNLPIEFGLNPEQVFERNWQNNFGHQRDR